MMHLDGARIWHVAAETGSTVSELCAPFDTVSLCFSKGLGESSLPACAILACTHFLCCILLPLHPAPLTSSVLTLPLSGAPIGSCLVGPAPFIRKARWFRKLFGGGMRQTGILAASAAYALTHNLPQLVRVHALAKEGKLEYFDYHPEKEVEAAAFCVEIMKARTRVMYALHSTTTSPPA